MLEQHVQIRVAPVTAEREEHVRLPSAEPLIDETRWLQHERAPVDAHR